MAQTGGISAPAVAITTAGALLMYIGIRNVPVLEGLRQVAAGKLPAARPKPGALVGSLADSLAAGAGALAAGGGIGEPEAGASSFNGSGPFPQLVQAAQQFAGDRYSQGRRWDTGYSDCSSFVGKSFKALGITPPGASVTTSYLAWGQLTKIDRSQVGAGDLICNTGHIIIATGNATGIGQENSRLNVEQGSIESLMGGAPFVCLRYVGPRGGAQSAAGLAV
jgi:cell wall-associated NlpC family hydrolase